MADREILRREIIATAKFVEEKDPVSNEDFWVAGHGHVLNNVFNNDINLAKAYAPLIPAELDKLPNTSFNRKDIEKLKAELRRKREAISSGSTVINESQAKELAQRIEESKNQDIEKLAGFLENNLMAQQEDIKKAGLQYIIDRSYLGDTELAFDRLGLKEKREELGKLYGAIRKDPKSTVREVQKLGLGGILSSQYHNNINNLAKDAGVYEKRMELSKGKKADSKLKTQSDGSTQYQKDIIDFLAKKGGAHIGETALHFKKTNRAILFMLRHLTDKGLLVRAGRGFYTAKGNINSVEEKGKYRRLSAEVIEERKLSLINKAKDPSFKSTGLTRNERHFLYDTWGISFPELKKLAGDDSYKTSQKKEIVGVGKRSLEKKLLIEEFDNVVRVYHVVDSVQQYATKELSGYGKGKHKGLVKSYRESVDKTSKIIKEGLLTYINNLIKNGN